MIVVQDVLDAAERMKGVAHRTHIFTSQTLDDRVGAKIYLKAENQQRGGSFKIRGAFNKISSLPRALIRNGLATSSSGNHAQAVAIAARLLNTQATIVMPDDAPPMKVNAVRGYGANIVMCDRYQGSLEDVGLALAAERELPFIHPYDDELVMAGQGTAALELLEDIPDLDLLVVPVGGGGLIAGCSTVAKSLQPAIRVVGVEPAAGDDARQSLKAGRRVTIPVPHTVADAQQLVTPGELTFEVIKDRVDDIVAVSDGDIIDAMVFLFERLKLVAEPSGVTGLTAVLGETIGQLRGKHIGIILSGGNVAADQLSKLTASGRE